MGSLPPAPTYNFGAIPKYSMGSGIAGGIGSLGGSIADESPLGGRNKF